MKQKTVGGAMAPPCPLIILPLLEGKVVRNPSVSLSPALTRNEQVEHYIRIKTHKLIALRVVSMSYVACHRVPKS